MLLDRLMEQVDGYCERVGFELWAEPLNAVTNLAFLLAAFALGRYLVGVEARTGRRDPQSRVLIFLLWAIGLGSLAFHTFATIWAGIADTLPIIIIILVYVYLALRRFFALPIAAAVLGPPALIGLAYVFGQTGFAGATYVPALIGMMVLSVAAALRGHNQIAYGLAVSSLVFGVSLGLRTIDEPMCMQITIGTHWAWHVLNALTLFLVIKLHIDHRRVET
ncbi:MAG: hypothetical protein CBC43_005945 [Rhizobiales bacterium TMED83]|jgi:hypothetical protein|nr:hypothetical protein [Rhodobiaceae bacterium]RPF93103.1 MAG: hypothetical protein CBC43_005945 [Rhizobiales bacterium TMED83]